MGWRALLLPTLAYVLGIATQTTFVFFLAPAYARAHGLGKLELVAFAVSALATMAVGVPAGRLADKVPRRRVMRLGWAMLAGAAAWLALAPPGVVTLALAAAAAGGGLGYGYTAFQSYVADVIVARDLANGYARTSALAFLGCAAGPLLGAGMLAALGSGPAGVSALALALSGVAATGALATLALPTARRAQSPSQHPARAGFVAAMLQSYDPRPSRAPRERGAARDEMRSVRAYAAGHALLGLGYGMTAPWFGPRLLDHYAIGAPAWGALLGWSSALAAGAVLLAGALARRRTAGPLRLAAAANLVTAAMMLGFAFAPLAVVAAGFFLARQFFGNVTNPLLSAGLAEEVSEETRGRSFGLMNVAWNLPWALGSVAGGVLLLVVGPWTFAVGAACIAAGPLVALALRQQGGAPGTAGRRVAGARGWRLAQRR